MWLADFRTGREMTHNNAKRCFTVEPCEYRADCVHGTLSPSQATTHFQPQRTGFHCDYYKSRSTAPWGEGREDDND